MGIAFIKYVKITSGVAGQAALGARELIGRIVSVNPLIPPGTILEFTTLASVLSYFGSASEEYKRALQYFSRISKAITTANKISYSRWVDADAAPLIFGAELDLSLAEFNLITDGSFKVTIGGVTASVTALDLSAAGSFAAIATDLQVAIRAHGTGTQFTAATVTFDNTRGGFNFVGGDDSADVVISVQEGTAGTNIAEYIGWLPEDNGSGNGAIWSNGALAETITDTLTNAASINNNYGSFVFTNQAALSLDEVTEAATWNAAQDVMFQYYVPVTASNASAYNTALINLAGCGVTLDPQIAGQYPEATPMAILAATNYAQRNSTQNYMFQQDNITPSVSDTLDSDAYDALNINYYGVTQEAGQNIAFYQTGVLMGLITSPQKMNIYANEQWLKSAAGVAIMNLLLALSKVSANVEGQSQILSVLQNIIDQALFNGTFSVGKILTNLQIASITSLSGDPDAWFQVQGSGYWVTCNIVNAVVNGKTQYSASYLLIYSKDDVISKVEGQHVLI